VCLGSDGYLWPSGPTRNGVLVQARTGGRLERAYTGLGGDFSGAFGSGPVSSRPRHGCAEATAHPNAGEKFVGQPGQHVSVCVGGQCRQQSHGTGKERAHLDGKERYGGWLITGWLPALRGSNPCCARPTMWCDGCPGGMTSFEAGARRSVLAEVPTRTLSTAWLLRERCGSDRSRQAAYLYRRRRTWARAGWYRQRLLEGNLAPPPGRAQRDHGVTCRKELSGLLSVVVLE